MITGILGKEKFAFYKGKVSSNSALDIEYIENLYNAVTIGFQPQDGEPELYLQEMLKKSGAKELKYIPDADTENKIY